MLLAYQWHVCKLMASFTIPLEVWVAWLRVLEVFKERNRATRVIRGILKIILKLNSNEMSQYEARILAQLILLPPPLHATKPIGKVCGRCALLVQCCPSCRVKITTDFAS